MLRAAWHSHAMRYGRAIPSIGLILTGLSLGACSETAPLPEEPPMNLVLADRMPGELEAAPDAPAALYVAPGHGFTIALPQGWHAAAASAGAESAAFEDAARAASLIVSVSTDSSDAGYRRAIQAFRASGRDVSDQILDGNDYRGQATDRAGHRVRIRLLRARGIVIAARMRYPAEKGADFESLAAVTLDSLGFEQDLDRFRLNQPET